MARYYERRSGRDRRDWDIFVYPDRRSGVERRSGRDRRQADLPFNGPDRRRKVGAEVETPAEPLAAPENIESDESEKQYYSTAEVAQLTGLSQSTLLLWLRNKVIDGSRIKRSVEGRRLWPREYIEEIRRIKERYGWKD